MECADYFSTSSSINGTLAQFGTSGQGAIVRAVTSYEDGYAGFRLANDAREWSMQIRTNDVFSIVDVTAGLHRLQIDPAGAVVINPGPLTIEDTQPRLTFKDTTASAHDTYLQMDADIFQINVNGVGNIGCEEGYTSLYREASIAGGGQKLGFFGALRQSKTGVGGSRSSGAALAALLVTLHDYGLISDLTDP
jgi:hypothetical protein